MKQCIERMGERNGFWVVSITRMATHQYLKYNYTMRRDAMARYGFTSILSVLFYSKFVGVKKAANTIIHASSRPNHNEPGWVMGIRVNETLQVYRRERVSTGKCGC